MISTIVKLKVNYKDESTYIYVDEKELGYVEESIRNWTKELYKYNNLPNRPAIFFETLIRHLHFNKIRIYKFDEVEIDTEEFVQGK